MLNHHKGVRRATQTNRGRWGRLEIGLEGQGEAVVFLEPMTLAYRTGTNCWSHCLEWEERKVIPWALSSSQPPALFQHLQLLSRAGSIKEARRHSWLLLASWMTGQGSGESISLCYFSQIPQIQWLKNNAHLFCYSSGVRYLKMKVPAELCFFWRLLGKICFLFQLLEATYISCLLDPSFIFQVHYSNPWLYCHVSFLWFWPSFFPLVIYWGCSDNLG